MARLAIDPGNDLGWAILVSGRLLDAGLGRPPNFTGEVVIERPQVYPGTSSKKANDLITLAICVGRQKERFEALGCTVEEILPHTWKGSLDADICIQRVLASLLPDEGNLLISKLSRVPEKKQHNVIDAVGLGIWSYVRARAAVFTRLP